MDGREEGREEDNNHYLEVRKEGRIEERKSGEETSESRKGREMER